MERHLCSHIIRLNVKMTILPKLIYRFKAILQNPSLFLQKFMSWPQNSYENTGIQKLAKTILKKNKVGGFPVSNFKTYYEATVIKTVWYWYKDGHTDQQNRIESPGTNPYIYDQLILGVPRRFNGKRTIVFSTNGARTIRYPCVHEVEPLPHTLNKNELKISKT